MSNFYLYIRKKGNTEEIIHCEKVLIDNVLKEDKLFGFLVLFHKTVKEDFKQFTCTEIQTGMTVAKGKTLKDCIKNFEDKKKNLTVKQAALTIGSGKTLLSVLTKQFNL